MRIDHPVARSVSAARESIREVADPATNRLWQLTDSDGVQVVAEILRLEASLAGLKLQVLGAIDERDVTTTTTGLGTAAWLHATARQSLATAHRDVAIARSLHHRFGRLTSAMANGDVSAEQAVAVVGVLKDLPVDLDHDQVVAAEETVVEFAARYGPRELRALAGHLLEVVAPDVAEAAEGEILERQDREARRSQYLRWRDDGDGALQFSGEAADRRWRATAHAGRSDRTPRHEGDSARP